ncbi:MAG: hypothetical protein KJ714_05615 [Euryarchaeota archaeon]|nr:hypothetical protein [Euryarchaeota archaeon]
MAGLGGIDEMEYGRGVHPLELRMRRTHTRDILGRTTDNSSKDAVEASIIATRLY